jgi:hypothetical protein
LKHSFTVFMLIIFGIFLQHCSIKQNVQLLNHLLYLSEYKTRFFSCSLSGKMCFVLCICIM